MNSLFFLLAKFHFKDRILEMEAFVFQWRIPVYLFGYVSGSFPVFSNPRILYPTKGQIISKLSFLCLQFLPKNKERHVTWLVFWKNSRLDNLLLKLTDL